MVVVVGVGVGVVGVGVCVVWFSCAAACGFCSVQNESGFRHEEGRLLLRYSSGAGR